MKNENESQMSADQNELPKDMFGRPEDISYEMSSDDPEDEEEKDDDDDAAEWGDVDPSHDPRQPAGPMDPSGPGSAV